MIRTISVFVSEATPGRVSPTSYDILCKAVKNTVPVVLVPLMAPYQLRESQLTCEQWSQQCNLP